MIRFRILKYLFIALIAAAGAAYAQDQAQMEAMMKLMSPGEEHKLLSKMAGDWTFSNKMWMDPSKAPEEGKGTMHAEMILDGRYVQSVWKGQAMGMPFEGHGTDGYDNLAKKYVSSWVDNMGTGIMYQTGICDAKGLCTMTGEMIDPMSGQKVTTRSVSQWMDDKTIKLEMFSKDASGKEMKTMELVATKTQ